TLIEPTSGNTGIALAMAAATRGYRMVLIMPEHLSAERRQSMRAFGAEIILTPQKGGMEAARDLADKMVREGEGTMLDQFANPDNSLAHYESTGPEIWRDTEGRITHFVSSMGTTGTIMGCSRFFKEKNRRIEIIGCQPAAGSRTDDARPHLRHRDHSGLRRDPRPLRPARRPARRRRRRARFPEAPRLERERFPAAAPAAHHRHRLRIARRR